MKYFLCALFITIVTNVAIGQIQSPVKWRFSAKKIADKTYEIHLTPTVQNPWHLYSQNLPKGGALPTKISFGKNPLITMTGKPKETGKLVSRYEEVFGVTVKYFEGKADFVQMVKVKGEVKTNVSGTVKYMVCNDQQCLPPKTVKFSVRLE